MEFKDVGVLIGAVATATGILITIFKLLNLKARSHALALQAFALADALELQIEKEEGEVRRVATQLRLELMVRGQEASQDFLSRTAPKRMNLVSILAWFIIFIPLTATIWGIRNVPGEFELLRNILGFGIPVAVVLICSALWALTTSKMNVEEALLLKRMPTTKDAPSSKPGGFVRWVRLRSPQARGDRSPTT